MNNTARVLLVFICLLSLAFTACRTKRGITLDGHKLHNLSANKLLDSIHAHRLLFNYFSSKLSTDITSDSLNKEFKTSLKIRKDSAIWCTYTIASIVGASSLVTRDSVTVVNKMEKNYFKADFNYINSLFNTELDYFMLEDLLVGNLLNYDQVEKFKSHEDSTYYVLSSVGKRRLRRAMEKERLQKKEPYIYRYWIYPGIFRPARTIINDLTDTTSLDIEYLSYEQVDSVYVPLEVRITATSPRKKAVVNLKYSRTRVNEFTEFPFKIPDGYEKMDQ
ncbi:MAG: DUF4292 domain-containing protein [Bacteroidota bacterium]